VIAPAGLFTLGHPLFAVREELRKLYEEVFEDNVAILKRQVLRNVLVRRRFGPSFLRIGAS